MKNKEISYVFRGPFKEYIPKYIEYKRSLGFKVGSSVYYTLKGMDDFFNKYGCSFDSPTITKEMTEAFVAIRGTETTKTQHMRMSIIRQFSLFMNRIGFDFYVYPESNFVKVNSDFIPYIFAKQEVNRLIKILDDIPYSPRYPTYHIVYPMLFRMLLGCGLRINEALGLKMKSIDMENGLIMLDTTKNNTQRMLPMSHSLHKYCSFYITRMGFHDCYEGYFYPNKNGKEYNSTPIYCQFRKFMLKAKICREDGTTPRVHDIRHTFSVYSLEKMVAEGKDIYCALPILSNYLGHRGIESTEKYLRMTIESSGSVIEIMKNLYQGIFPEVIKNEI